MIRNRVDRAGFQRFLGDLDHFAAILTCDGAMWVCFLAFGPVIRAVNSDVFLGFNKGSIWHQTWPKNAVLDDFVFVKNCYLEASLCSKTLIFESATSLGAFWADYRPNPRSVDLFSGHFLISIEKKYDRQIASGPC